MTHKHSASKLEKSRPRLYDWSYLVLKPLSEEVRNFAKISKKNIIVLDVGSGASPYHEFFKVKKYTTADIDIRSHPDLKITNNKIPCKNEIYDVIVCTQVLEHVFNFSKLIQEMHKKLKPGGRIFVSVPFVYHEHGIPNDYWRFSKYALLKMFPKFKVEKIISNGGYLTSICFLSSVFLFFIPLPKIVKLPFYVFINLMGVSFDRFFSLFGKINKKLQLKPITKFLEKVYFALPINWMVIIKKPANKTKPL